MGESVGEVKFLVRKLREGGMTATVMRIAKITGGRSLTARQEEVLRLAYMSGFFESPHGSSVRQLAKALGCSPSTFVRLLRIAERKVTAEKLQTGRA